MTTRPARLPKRGRDRNGACTLLRCASNLIAEYARLSRQVIYRLRAAICAGSGHPESSSKTLTSSLELNSNALA